MDSFLITGSAGFIGFHLANTLLEKGYTVIGYDNINDYYDTQLKYERLNVLSAYANFIFYEKDLTDYNSLQDIINTHHIKFVIHLAAQAGVRYSITHPQTYIDSNIIGTFNVLEACRNCDVEQLMYASSSSVYGNSSEVKLCEQQKVDAPVSLYAATKKSNELLAHAYSNNYKFNTVGLRFFTVYGPYGRPDMAYYHFLEKILAGDTIKVYNYGNQCRDFTYIDDLIHGMMKLIEVQKQKEKIGEYKIYNIGNGNPVELKDFIRVIEDTVGKKAKIEYIERMTGDVDKTYADITLLKNVIGYSPRTNISEGIRKFYDWYLKYNKGKIQDE